MNCKSLIIVGCLLVSTPGLLCAQNKKFNRSDSYEEITLGGGVMVPIKGMADASGMAFADYAAFGPGGLGFHGGVRYSASNNDISTHLELPLKVAWRSNIRQPRRDDFFEALVPETYMTYTPTRGIGYRTESFGSSLLSALMCIVPQRIEFNAGIAPGYIFGGDVQHESTIYGMNGLTETRQYTVHKKFGFSTSVEAGMKLTYYIWRFELSLNPAVHYSLTDNFDIRSTTVSGKPSRLFFSFSGGLGFMF